VGGKKPEGLPIEGKWPEKWEPITKGEGGEKHSLNRKKKDSQGGRKFFKIKERRQKRKNVKAGEFLRREKGN